MGDTVGLLEPRAGHAPAAPALQTELLGHHRLDITRSRHCEYQIVVVDQILNVELTRVDLQNRPPGH